MVAFLSATMLAVDVGMLMVARTEAQNAADAGALAGAVAPGYYEWDDRTATGPAVTNAIGAAKNTDYGVMHAQVSVLPEDVTFPTITQIRVPVQRSTARGNALSTFIAPMFGINTVDIGAVAVAEVSPANAMTCVKPFTIPDKWIEKQTPPWDPSDTFDLYDKKGDPLPDPDIYVPLGPAGDPDNPQTGYTGYNAVADKGTLVTLKAGTGTNITPSFYFPYSIGGVSGADEYRENITGCNSTIMDFDDLLMAEPGNMSGPTKQGIEDLIAKDQSARWSESEQRVISSMHPSPRVIAIPLFDPVYYETGKQNGRYAD